jgi:hypothetical protein
MVPMLFLLRIEGFTKNDLGFQISPAVKLTELRYPPGTAMTTGGDAVEIRHPNGVVIRGTVGVFGIEAWREDGHLVVHCDPADPELTLTISGVDAEDLVPESEVWVELRSLAQD